MVGGVGNRGGIVDRFVDTELLETRCFLGKWATQKYRLGSIGIRQRHNCHFQADINFIRVKWKRRIQRKPSLSRCSLLAVGNRRDNTDFATVVSLVEPFLSPHSLNRHDACCRWAGADRVATVIDTTLRWYRSPHACGTKCRSTSYDIRPRSTRLLWAKTGSMYAAQTTITPNAVRLDQVAAAANDLLALDVGQEALLQLLHMIEDELA